MKEKLRDITWYRFTVTACCIVALYVALTHLEPVLSAVKTFLGYFSALFLGCVLAYLMNPMARFFSRTLFRRLRREKLRWPLSILLTLVTLTVAFEFLLGTLIPQLIESVTTLLDNMDGYIASLRAWIEALGVAETLKLDELIAPSGDFVTKLVSLLRDNAGKILNVSSAAGRSLLNWLVALILSVYLLGAKESLKSGASRLTRALMSEKGWEKTVTFLRRCDMILSRYIVYSLLDALIVGAVNAVFMSCLGMQYVGLVSLVVGLTNLIPTFGPVIGYVLGGFILLLVNPIHALIFVLFSFGLQFLDGYVIKPKLFGNSLGVSGLLILVAVVIFGEMFGVVGMLLAIPLAAILDFAYREELLPALEKRHN